MPTLHISIQQRNDLRAAAHSLRPVVLIGDKGLSDAVLKEIDVHLNAHQLIKIRVSGDDRESRIAAFDTICTTLQAEPIHHIGKILTIYRRNPERADLLDTSEPATRAVRKANEPYTPKKLAAVGVSKTKKKPSRQPSNPASRVATADTTSKKRTSGSLSKPRKPAKPY